MTSGSFKPSDYHSSRLAVSALTVVVVLFVAIGIGVELAFLPRASASSTPTTTSTATTTTTTLYSCTSCGTPSSTVNAAVTGWLADFNNRNVTGIGNFYGQDAVVTVTGGRASGGLEEFGGAYNGLVLDGAYKGLDNIKILYGSSISGVRNLTASIANYSETGVNPYNANVSLTLSMVGFSDSVGSLNITVDANQQWNYIGGQWQIVKGTWNYVAFNEQYPVAAGP
jgi:hypothetical protein